MNVPDGANAVDRETVLRIVMIEEGAAKHASFF
jgi:hypothetical protein